MQPAKPEPIVVPGPLWEDENRRPDLDQDLAMKGLRVVRVIKDRAGVGEYELEVESTEA